MITFISAITEGIRNRDYVGMASTLGDTITRTSSDYRHIVGTLPKINFMLNRMEYVKDTIDGDSILIDVDCLVLKTIDDVFDDDFDIGVCYRARMANERGHRDDVNAGVVFIKRNGKEFIDRWIKECGSVRSGDWWYDQAALNNLTGSPTFERTTEQYFDCKPFVTEYVKRDGITYKFLDAWQYCCPFSTLYLHQAKIVHYCHTVVHKGSYVKLYRIGDGR